jgi:hypothetical protein
MSMPTTNLEALPRVLPVGSGAGVRIVLGNPSAQELATDLPARWQSALAMRLWGPDGTERTWAPFPEVGAAAPESFLTLYEGAELESSFSLPGAWLSRPGSYRLSAALRHRAGVLEFPEAELDVEPVRHVQLAVASSSHVDEDDVVPYWLLLASPANAFLKQGTVGISDRTGLPVLAPSSELLELPSGSVGLTAPAASDTPAPIAWLCGDSFHAGVHSYRFVRSEVALPGSPARILSRMIAGRDGGVWVGVLSADAFELWALEVKPVVLQAPGPLEGEEEEWVDTSPRPRLPVPGLAATVRLPAAASGAAIVARDPGAAPAVAYVSTESSGLGVRFALSIEEAIQCRWRRVRLEGASPLPGLDPVLTADGHGGMRLSLLVTSEDPAAPFGRLGLVHLGFDPEGEPAVWPGLGWEDQGALPSSPLAASLLVHRIADASEIRCDWCVVCDDGRTVARQGSRAISESTLPAAAVHPLVLLSQEGRLALAVHHAADVWFAEV